MKLITEMMETEIEYLKEDKAGGGKNYFIEVYSCKVI